MTRLYTLQPSSIVVIEDSKDDESIFSFHAASEMATTIDMETVTLEEARSRGAVACSKCFSDQDCTNYDFDYTLEGAA